MLRRMKKRQKRTDTETMGKKTSGSNNDANLKKTKKTVPPCSDSGDDSGSEIVLTSKSAPKKLETVNKKDKEQREKILKMESENSENYSDSDNEVDAFTKQFMLQKKMLAQTDSNQRDEEISDDEEEDDNKMDEGDETSGDEAEEEIVDSGNDLLRARSRMSPALDSGSDEDVEEDDMQRARSRMSPVPESESDGEGEESRVGNKMDSDMARARSRMSPVQDSDSEEQSSDNAEEEEEKSVTPPKQKTKGAHKKPLEKLGAELRDMPFEDIQKLKQKIGLKAFNAMMAGTFKGNKDQRFEKPQKNKPMEMSSKKPVSRFREVIPVKKRKIRDPRFDDLSGTYNEALFQESYGFLSEMRTKEKEVLKKKLVELKAQEGDTEEEQQKVKYLLNRMNQQDMAAKQRSKQSSIKRRVKKQEQELVKEGKLPFYLKKSEQRKLELAEQYRELKKAGKLDKYLAKKRKKNAQKEKRKMPGKQTVFS